MKHVKLFEDFLFEGDPVYGRGTPPSDAIVTKGIADLIKKSPKAKQSVEYCRQLVDTMRGFGTDESKIYSIFSKIKTKGEMIQIMAIWDMMGLNYDLDDPKIPLGRMAAVASWLGKKITGTSDAYARQVSNRINLLGRNIKDTLNSLDFWNKADTRAADAYYKERAAWFKKNPNQQKTSLFYWLREDLDSEELAKLNGMIKKFGMKISS